MNEKFNKNAKVEKITTMLGMAVRLIVIDPLATLLKWSKCNRPKITPLIMIIKVATI